VVSEAFLQSGIAASPAGNRWQTGLLSALRALGRDIRIRGCTPQPAWPRGPLLARPHAGASADGLLDWSMQGYLNLPLAKLNTQYASLLRAVRRDVRREGAPSVTLSYNAGLPEAFTARWLQRELGVPWVCCVADFPIVSQASIGGLRRRLTARYARRQKAWLEEARGRVYLSWAMYQEDPSPHRFYLEGGVKEVHDPAPRRRSGGPPVLMFAGSLDRWTGVELLLDALPFLRAPFELWICGRGALAPRVEEAARRDPRIRFLGLVSREELDARMGQADVFVNPRPSSVDDNRYNFPSKLLDYLAWARPIVSTITPGIPPAYLEILTPVRDETPAGLAAALQGVLEQSPREHEETGERVREHVQSKLLWSAQARKLWAWLESEGLLA
jgi:glycosyltransferase involved in cell wall biosynthesis